MLLYSTSAMNKFLPQVKKHCFAILVWIVDWIHLLCFRLAYSLFLSLFFYVTTCSPLSTLPFQRCYHYIMLIRWCLLLFCSSCHWSWWKTNVSWLKRRCRFLKNITKLRKDFWYCYPSSWFCNFYCCSTLYLFQVSEIKKMVYWGGARIWKSKWQLEPVLPVS